MYLNHLVIFSDSPLHLAFSFTLAQIYLDRYKNMFNELSLADEELNSSITKFNDNQDNIGDESKD